MSNEIKDRSKERRPGIIGTAKTIAKDVQKFGKEVQDFTTTMQTGEVGSGSWNTNLMDTLGSSVYEGIIGKQSVGSIGKSAIERALFGISFPVGSDSSIRFDTKPGEQKGRDYNLTFTKKF
tara:strand:+ start:289 stop:651 length:363 start_codon:yes stop_codon:yes gene_type:complete